MYNTCTDSTSVIRKKKRGKKSPRGQFLRPAPKNVCVAWTEVPCCDIWEAVLRLLSETHFAAVKTGRQAAGLLLPRPCGGGAHPRGDSLSACSPGTPCFLDPGGCDLGRAPCVHAGRALPSTHGQETVTVKPQKARRDAPENQETPRPAATHWRQELKSKLHSALSRRLRAKK